MGDETLPGESAPFSVVVPVHNEAPLLEATVMRMLAELRRIGGRFELLLCENGSTDATQAIAGALAAREPEVVVESLPVGDYGLALRHAIVAARHDRVVVYNVDYWSTAFATEALGALCGADLVLGSKAMRGASDVRPLLRRMITRGFNTFLRVAYGFRGTDTHGMKALRRSAILPVLSPCVSSGWLFDTELVLRAQRAGLRVREIPVAVTEEVRPPSCASIARRVPPVLVGMLRLWTALRRARTPTPVL